LASILKNRCYFKLPLTPRRQGK